MRVVMGSATSAAIFCASARLDETGVPIRTDWPGPTLVPHLTTPMSCACCLGAFLAAVFGDRFFLAADFGVVLPARTLDFAFLDVVCFAAFLRAGLALALPRFDLLLRAATRFFALAIAVPYDV